MVDLSIIVVTFESRKYLIECFRSIFAHPLSSTLELIVVDNNSSDGTVGFVQESYPGALLLVNTENVGFAAAVNQGIKTAQGRYLLLLNPDTIIRKGSLDELVLFMDSEENCGAAGPALIDSDGRLQQTGVRFPNLWNTFVESIFLDRAFPRSRVFGRHKESYKIDRLPRSVDFVQGTCMIVRSTIVGEVGSLDDRFFMYFEEVDWCWRIKQAGWKIVLCPAITTVHLGGETIGHFDEYRLIHYHRSLLLFSSIHYGFVHTLMFRILIVLRSLIRVLLWIGIAAVKPLLREKARSSIRGYVRTVLLVLSP